MYYQYELAHFKGNMGHDVASDGGTVRAAGQQKLARRQDGKGGGGQRRSARRVHCSRWWRRRWEAWADADWQGTRAGGMTMACNQINIYKIKI